MRMLALLSTLLSFINTVRSVADSDSAAQPYRNALPGRSGNPLLLLKRQSCPTGYAACTALGTSDACCPSDTVCARDQNGNVACCPTNAVCTGVISGTATASTTGSTTPFVLGGSTTASTTAAASLPSGYSTVSNLYYPFILIPTTYANSQACLSAYTACQSASTACFNSLAGQNGVTVSGLGTLGVTQSGATGTLVSSASSICSSLSQEGCYAIQSTVCSSFGSGTAGTTQTTAFIQVNAGPTGVARCTGAFYTAAVAAVAGAGMARLAIA